MKTVLYLDWRRNRKFYIRTLLQPVILLAVLFVISILVDRLAPVVNYRYMRWPDMVKDLLGLPSWNRNLYVNLWQILALIHPFYVIYTMMTGLSGSVISEERMETVVYLKNLSIGRSVLLGSKVLIWLAWLLIVSLVLGIENLLFFKVLRADQLLWTSFRYYMQLGLAALAYMAIALFLASFQKLESTCEDHIFAILILSFLLARLHAVIGLFGTLLTQTGREGKVLDTVYMLANKLQVLTLVSPMTWCWPAISVERNFIVCGVLITVILTVMGWSIYTHEKVIYRSR